MVLFTPSELTFTGSPLTTAMLPGNEGLVNWKEYKDLLALVLRFIQSAAENAVSRQAPLCANRP